MHLKDRGLLSCSYSTRSSLIHFVQQAGRKSDMEESLYLKNCIEQGSIYYNREVWCITTMFSSVLSEHNVFF